jgi:hypothetical protein
MARQGGEALPGGCVPQLEGVVKGQLPRDYERFDHDVLEDLLRTFDSQEIRAASGDMFGRIYEYFLMEFAMQGAQDNGEFFTPPSLVQTTVNVIEPEHGTVLDPSCGSGGMFVQSSHFIERLGQDTSGRVTFFGQEKTATTIRQANDMAYCGIGTEKGSILVEQGVRPDQKRKATLGTAHPRPADRRTPTILVLGSHERKPTSHRGHQEDADKLDDVAGI